MEPDKPPDIQKTIDTFVQLTSQHANRLKRGTKLREKMHNAVAEGKRPTGYRAEWLRASAIKIVEVLGEIAEEFDEKHAADWDKSSILDLMDILSTANGMLKHEAGLDD